MNVSELKDYKQMSHDDFAKLDLLCKKSGNCAMNGYFGSSLTDCTFDDEGVLEFSSSKSLGDTTFNSIGCVLGDSVLIKQIQTGPVSDYNKLYSWDVDNGMYTYLEFEDKTTLNTFYGKIKRAGVSLCDNDLSSTIADMGLSLDNVTKVLVRQGVDHLTTMLEDDAESLENADVNSLRI